MNILELKRWPRLYAKIRYYQWFIKQEEEYDKNTQELNTAFDWNTTDEKFAFWEYVCDYQFEAAKDLHPELFEEVWIEFPIPIKNKMYF